MRNILRRFHRRLRSYLGPRSDVYGDRKSVYRDPLGYATVSIPLGDWITRRGRVGSEGPRQTEMEAGVSPGFFARLGRKLDQYLVRKKKSRAAKQGSRNAIMVIKSAEGRRSRKFKALSLEEQVRQRDQLEKAGIKRVSSLTPGIRMK